MRFAPENAPAVYRSISGLFLINGAIHLILSYVNAWSSVSHPANMYKAGTDAAAMIFFALGAVNICSAVFVELYYRATVKPKITDSM